MPAVRTLACGGRILRQSLVIGHGPAILANDPTPFPNAAPTFGSIGHCPGTVAVVAVRPNERLSIRRNDAFGSDFFRATVRALRTIRHSGE